MHLVLMCDVSVVATFSCSEITAFISWLGRQGLVNCSFSVHEG